MAENERLTEEEMKAVAENAIIKYEKGSKPYRPVYYQNGEAMTCSKCGSHYGLMKVVFNNETYYFCQKCVREKAIELKNKQNKKFIPLKDNN